MFVLFVVPVVPNKNNKKAYPVPNKYKCMYLYTYISSSSILLKPLDGFHFNNASIHPSIERRKKFTGRKKMELFAFASVHCSMYMCLCVCSCVCMYIKMRYQAVGQMSKK